MTVAPTHIPRHPVHRRWSIVTLVALVGILAGALGYALRGNGSSTSGGSLAGSGTPAADARTLPPFTSVDLAGSNVVTIAVGRKQSVVVKADNNLIRHVTTSVKHGRLVVGNTPGSISTKSPMEVDVTVPALRAVSLSGSGVVVLAGVHAPSLSIDLSGSGIVRASGTATRLTATVDGSGDAQLGGLAAKVVHASISGSGRIVVSAAQSLAAQIPGNGAIVYFGNPSQVTTNVTGNGSVTRG
jgi:hypothetical protein